MIAKQTIVIGLNPAVQRTITLSSPLKKGSVNRGSSVTIGIGGKGQNNYVASINMKTTPLLAQLLGKGAEGDTLENTLSNLSPISSNSILSTRTNAPCRTCCTLIDPFVNEVTEIVEPTGVVTAGEIEILLSTIEARFLDNKAKGVAIMG